VPGLGVPVRKVLHLAQLDHRPHPLPGYIGVPQALRSPAARILATHLRHNTPAYRSPSEFENNCHNRIREVAWS
jgi:hypothetical protein